MDSKELDAPEVLRHEQIAHDTVCFHIKKPFGFLTGAITRYQGEDLGANVEELNSKAI